MTGQQVAAEAYHLAGDGALVLLRTSDPVAPAPDADRAGEGADAKRSAWDEMQDEVDGRPTGVKFVRDGRYDPRKVEALRTRLLDQLAQHGGRVRGLRDDEHVTVVVSGSSPWALRPGSKVEVVARDPSAVAGQDARQAAVVMFDALTGQRSAVGRSVLTIRVSVADCRAFVAGRMNAETFNGRAVIAAY
jgi:hypothetical protein